MINEKWCPVCRSPNVTEFFETLAAPVFCNLLWPAREAALQTPRADIVLGFCDDCSFIYNLAFDSERLRYAPGYENALHFSPRFQTYAQELVARLIAQYDLHDKDIIEIGCGDGDFLALLCELGGNRGVGFDPSYENERRHDGITIIREVYSERYADYPVDFLCCRHVLEHIPQPRKMLAELRRAIGGRRNTVVFFEVPNVLLTLRDLAIWDVIYEHYAYYSAVSLTRAFCACGFTVHAVAEAFGGQYLCLEARSGESADDFSLRYRDEVKALRGYIDVFAANFRSKVEMWQQQLEQITKSGKRVVVWGAGSKGVTFLNTLKLQGQISYVVDVNPRKQGKFVAGTGQQIVPPDFLQSYRPEMVIVMNPIYADEIRQNLNAMPKVAAEVVLI